MTLNKELSVPLYRQLIDIFERKIVNREWGEGYHLPSEKELAKQYNVSNITVKRAVLELVNKELLYRQRGKGTFVASRIKNKDFRNLITFGSEKERPHQTTGFSVEEASAAVAKNMKIDRGSLIYKINRLKLDNQKPIGIEKTFLNYNLCRNITQPSIENELIYKVLSDKGIQLGKAKIYFSSIEAGKYESDIFTVKKGTPLNVFKRVTYSNKGEVIEFSEFVIRQDKTEYFIEVNF